MNKVSGGFGSLQERFKDSQLLHPCSSLLHKNPNSPFSSCSCSSSLSLHSLFFFFFTQDPKLHFTVHLHPFNTTTQAPRSSHLTPWIFVFSRESSSTCFPPPPPTSPTPQQQLVQELLYTPAATSSFAQLKPPPPPPTAPSPPPSASKQIAKRLQTTTPEAPVAR